MSDDVGERYTSEEHRAIASRGRRRDEWHTSREDFPSKSRAQIESMVRSVSEPRRGSPTKNIDDADYGFLADLVAAQGSEPISPRRAQAIKDRYGLESRSVTDPEAAALALTGLEVILIAASFVPPLAVPADVMLVLLGFLKGKPQEGILNAATIPLGLLKSTKAIRLVETLLKPAVRGTKFVARSIKDYKDVARFLLRFGGTRLPEIAKTVRVVKAESKWGKAAMEAAEVLKAEEASKGFRAASSAAGTRFHSLIGAAEAGERVDFKGPRLIGEVKTHFAPIMDEFTFRPGNEQVVAYLLEDLVGKGVTREGRVIHVFINRKGEAVMVTVDALDGRKIVDVINAVIPK